MAFCTNCGAPVSGPFCTKCGTRLGAPGAGAPAPSAGPAPESPPPAVPAGPKKRGPVFWIVLGCLGLIVIGFVLVASTGLFVFYKAKQAGLDPELIAKNPAMAVAKLIAAVDPDIEVVAIDEDRGIIRVRNKKTGKALTVNLEEAKKGKIVFEDDESGKVEFQAKGEGDKTSLEIRGNEGAVRLGGGEQQLPDWLQVYPGAEAAGNLGITSKEGAGGMVAYKTDATVEDVVAYYEHALKSAGLTTETNKIQAGSEGAVTMITAKDESSQRTAQIMISGKPGETTFQITFESKK